MGLTLLFLLMDRQELEKLTPLLVISPPHPILANLKFKIMIIEIFITFYPANKEEFYRDH